MDDNEELARARLAFITAGRPPLGAPRRAEGDAPVDHAEPGPPERSPSGVGRVLSGARASAWAKGLRGALTPRHALVVVLLLVASALVTVFALGRSAATEVPVTVEAAASGQSPPTSTPTLSPAVYMRVHVAGAVARPGVVQVAAGSIVQDALQAAGGLTPDADPDALNLAAPVSDGMQILIGTKAAPQGSVTDGGGRGKGTAGESALDLNTATQEQLEALPGVGPVTAAAILAWREEHGSFSTVDELQEIGGIGPKTYAKLAPLVRT